MINPSRRFAISLAKRINPRQCRGRTYASKTAIYADEAAKLNELLDKFKDPSSHYHIPPGSRGPIDEEDHSSSRDPSSLSSSSTSSSSASASTSTSASKLAVKENEDDGFAQSRVEAMEMFRADGYDVQGTLEWPVAWGDCDMFQHVNNARYVRWIETARIRYAESLELPGGQVRGMLSGKGTGFILKDVYLKYIRPVTWPDTVLIASRAHDIQQSKSSFKLKHAIWSLKDKRLAAIGDSTMVMYDYARLRKGVMTDEFRRALEERTPSISA